MPIGKPPAKGFAKHMTSGVTSQFWQPNSLPVRPKLVCTSSRINKDVFFIADLPHRLQVAVRRNAHAAFAANWLHQNGGCFFGYGFTNFISVVRGNMFEFGTSGMKGSRYFLSHVAEGRPWFCREKRPLKRLFLVCPCICGRV